ncbi:hypothetical protein BLAT2472_20029 [Burkholderia latens]
MFSLSLFWPLSYPADLSRDNDI